MTLSPPSPVAAATPSPRSMRRFETTPATIALSLALALGASLATGCSKRYQVGDKVLVEWEEKGPSYPAYITAIEAPGRYRVHFDGYEPIWDESFAATRIKGKVTGPIVAPPPPAKVKNRMGVGAKAQQSTFRVGDRVKVDWKGSFYPASIVTVLGNENYRVHYDGYDANWDENVDISRIQRK